MTVEVVNMMQIHGDYFTMLCRQAVLAGKWRTPFNELKDMKVPIDAIYGILDGTKEFVGVGEFDIVDNVDEVYVQELNETYAGLYKMNDGTVLKPIYKISNICPAAIYDANVIRNGGYGNIQMSPRDSKRAKIVRDHHMREFLKYSYMKRGFVNLNEAAAAYYLRDQDLEGKYVIFMDGSLIIYQVAVDYPIFMNAASKAKDVVVPDWLEDLYIGEETDARMDGWYVKPDNVKLTDRRILNSIDAVKRASGGKANVKINKSGLPEVDFVISQLQMENHELDIREKIQQAQQRGQESLSRRIIDIVDSSYDLSFDVKPTKDFESQYGWILPNGDWYNCGAMQHDMLIEEILGDDYCKDKQIGSLREHVNDLGWISRNSSIMMPGGAVWQFGRKAPTQTQVDTIFEYCNKWGIRFPQKEIDARS